MDDLCTLLAFIFTPVYAIARCMVVRQLVSFNLDWLLPAKTSKYLHTPAFRMLVNNIPATAIDLVSLGWSSASSSDLTKDIGSVV